MSRNTFLVNYTNRDDVQKERISNWLSAQQNGTGSILSLIEHAIDRFGYTNILDHEVSKKLYLERIYFDDDNKPKVLYTNTDKKETNDIISKKEKKSEKEIKNKKVTVENSDISGNSEEEDYLSNTDLKNF